MSSSISLRAVRSPSSVSTSTVDRIVQTSSCGFARFSWPSFWAYSNISTWIPTYSSCDMRRSGASPCSMSFANEKSASRSSTGMPTMSAITFIGSL